jgi:DNA-directed RNA polymerase beta subunit
VVKEDVIIGKITDIVQEGRVRTVDNSVTAKKACGVVDQVLLTDDMCGRRKVKVRTRDTRTPMIGSFFGGRALRRLLTLLFFSGDKFSSRHGQKVRGFCPPSHARLFTNPLLPRELSV